MGLRLLVVTVDFEYIISFILDLFVDVFPHIMEIKLMILLKPFLVELPCLPADQFSSVCPVIRSQ